MINQKLLCSIIFTLTITIAFAQNPVNLLDKAGERHGVWTKNYHKTNKKRYEGTFKHGKEIDTFKYYKLHRGKSVLSAIKVFNETDSLADVTFFASNKKIISKGRMNGKRYIGQWIYYHKNSTVKMTIENYNEQGLLNGERKVLYKNSAVAEIVNYKNDKLEGKAKWFSENNKPLRFSNYKNGELHGKIINYDSAGFIESEGNYIEDQKKDIWHYYKNGKLIKKIDHNNQKVIYKKQ